MAIRYYDEAIFAKIQRWVKDPHMKILKPDEVMRLFQLKAEQSNDKPLSLPLIALSRDTSFEVDVTSKRPLSFDGKILGQNSKQSIQLDAIPVTVHYQLDIYTKKYDEGDEYLRNFIFNLINFPKLTVEFTYNGVTARHTAYIRLLSSIQDNSDISERQFSGQFTRWTIQLELQDGYLFSIPFNDNWRIITEDEVDETGKVISYGSSIEIVEEIEENVI